MVAEKADGALFVASGDYTLEARVLADGKPVGLIDGKGLPELVERFRTPGSQATGVIPERREPAVRIQRPSRFSLCPSHLVLCPREREVANLMTSSAG